jgi:hypothetical protein
MAKRPRMILMALALLGAIAVIGDTTADAASVRNPNPGGASTGPSPIRPEFTRPGGTPGAPRTIGEPERFWDPALDAKNKKKRGNSMSN